MRRANGGHSSTASLPSSSSNRRSSNADPGWRIGQDDFEGSSNDVLQPPNAIGEQATPRPPRQATRPSCNVRPATSHRHNGPLPFTLLATSPADQKARLPAPASSPALTFGQVLSAGPVAPSTSAVALETGSLHSRLSATLATTSATTSDVAGLRTRAGLTQPAEGGTQLRSRTTSRSNVSLSGPSEPVNVETVAAKVAEHGPTTMASGVTTGVTGSGGNGTSRVESTAARPDQVTVEIPKKTREQRRKEIKKEFEKWDPGEKSGCRWTFVFDPSGRLCYYWSLVVSIAFLYNFWVIIYRFSFCEITMETLPVWFTLDYMADFLYVLDICFHFRTGYLDEGVLQTDGEKLRNHYLNSTMFYIDALCLLPLDFLYLSIRFNSILRGFRLVKIYRFWAFLDRTERHTNYPNVFRAINLTHYVLVIFHWNACIAHIIDKNEVFGSGERWFNNSLCGNDVMCEYLHAFYWSTLSLTTVGDLPRPRTKGQYLFLVIQLVLGLFLFATVLGHVANIVTNVSAARKEFQGTITQEAITETDPSYESNSIQIKLSTRSFHCLKEHFTLAECITQ